MVKLEHAQDALQTALNAIDVVTHAGNHERKVLGEKHMSGHYVKALQELERVKQHAENLVHRAEAQGA